MEELSPYPSHWERPANQEQLSLWCKSLLLRLLKIAQDFVSVHHFLKYFRRDCFASDSMSATGFFERSRTVV